MTASLYERLGGSDAIRRIADDLVENHAANPRIAQRFADTDLENLKQVAGDFFITGTGGPGVYKGKDMIATHKGMNIDNDEFMALLDDALAAMNTNNVGQREKEEVLFILFSLRDDVIRQ